MGLDAKQLGGEVPLEPQPLVLARICWAEPSVDGADGGDQDVDDAHQGQQPAKNVKKIDLGEYEHAQSVPRGLVNFYLLVIAGVMGLYLNTQGLSLYN